MARSKYIITLIIGCLVCSCNQDDETVALDTSLAALVAANTIEIDNVIACASGSANDQNTIIAYVYPRPGTTDIRYYETSDSNADKNDYTEYQRIAIEPTDFFNGYLKKFNRTTTDEKWVIITFFEDGKLQLSNPIRLKHKSKPTEFTDAVTVTNSMTTMPFFMWENGIFTDNAIYFQIVSDASEELLSGTYTFEKEFQYYILDNVVLNITRETPPALDTNVPYNFTLMGVSEDNWVNLFIEKQFSLVP